jgi:hypothetical protein
MISLDCPPPRVSLVVDLLFLGGSEGLDGVSGEWRLAHAIRVPQTQHRRKGGANCHQEGLGRPAWADRPGTFLALFWPVFSTLHLVHFGSLGPSIVGFGHRYLRDQVEGSLCMNFRSFHLGPREFSIQAHWSLPPLGASSHMVGAPWLSCKTFSELVASFLI